MLLKFEKLSGALKLEELAESLKGLLLQLYGLSKFEELSEYLLFCHVDFELEEDF